MSDTFALEGTIKKFAQNRQKICYLSFGCFTTADDWLD
jgi:hypothetical protein